MCEQQHFVCEEAVTVVKVAVTRGRTLSVLDYTVKITMAKKLHKTKSRILETLKDISKGQILRR